MLVHYEDKDYEFDIDDLDIGQASMLKRKYGLTLLSLQKGLLEGDPDALRAVYWLMLAQSGQRVNIDNVQFKIVKFANAIQAAVEAESEKDEDEDGDSSDPKPRK